MDTPPPHVLHAFNLPLTPATTTPSPSASRPQTPRKRTTHHLPGGQGHSALHPRSNVIIKPIEDPTEAEHAATIQRALYNIQLQKTQEDAREYQVAEPLRIATAFPATDRSQTMKYVADNRWTAARVIPGKPGPEGRWEEILRASRALHRDLLAVVEGGEPAFMRERAHRWAKGDRIAWGTAGCCDGGAAVDVIPPYREVYTRLMEMREPVETAVSQLIHGDLTGNVLFADEDGGATDGLKEAKKESGDPEQLPRSIPPTKHVKGSSHVPGIIDFSLYFRPVEFAEAVIVADGLLWYGGGEELVRLVGVDRFRLQMLVRALIFRLVATSEGARMSGVVDQAELGAFGRAVDLVRELMGAGSVQGEWWQVIDQIADTVVASMADPESAPAGVARTDLDAYILKPFGLYAKHDRLLFKANEPFLGALQKIESQFPHIVERARRILEHTATLPVPVDVSDSKAREKGAADPDTNFSQEMFVRCCCGLVRIDKTTSAASLLCISPEEYSFLYQWLYGIPDAPLPESETRPNTSTNLIKDDQTSVYSDILSIARAKPEGHVVTLAEELCKVVCAYQPTNDAIGRISELLPGLLEAFAVNLGGNMFPPMHRSVMMFILSYRGHIAKAFKDKICDKYPINEESHSSDEMSLDEQSKNAETDDRTSNDISYEAPPEQRDDISDSRQEYPEVEEEANSLPGLQEYMKLIKSAPAYNTLLASIRREFVFTQPEPNHMGDIRRTILTSVPVCSTSSLILDLEIYIMQYLLRLDPLTFVTGQEYTSPADVAIGNAITLTGSVTTAQVATCAEYLNETWPWTGPFVLQLVKDQARCTNLRPLKVTLPDGTILSSNRLDGNQIDGASLLFTVTGSANRITEIGEQLAWLVAATHSSPDGHGVASCRPFLKKRCLNHRTAWEIGATLDEKQINPVPLHGQCWHNLFRNPVVVEGYPIPRRPAGTPGIEIPLRMMAELIQTSWVNPFAGRLVIKGFSQMLVPTEIRGDIIMWHLLQSKEGERIS
ncbi:hypothetical protein FQN52_006776 [Onygenales sp. PD_12]|nr:hypothetical protein FQN52_006776 [Onygenales sp. PD_12]